MVELVADPQSIAPGAHALAFYANPSEAARQLARFLRGAEEHHQAAIVLTADEDRLRRYRAAVAELAPGMANAFRRIPGPHTHPTPEGRRPDELAMRFAQEHPQGATLCGD